MYFFHIKQVDPNDLDKLSKEWKEKVEYLIFPLVNPDTEYGQFLLDKNKTVYLDKLSGDDIHIVYTTDSSNEHYNKLIDFIFNHDQVDKEKLAIPSIVAISESNVFYISVSPNGNENTFEAKLNSVVKALKKDNPRIALSKYKFKELVRSPETRKKLVEVAWDIFRTFVLT